MKHVGTQSDASALAIIAMMLALFKLGENFGLKFFLKTSSLFAFSSSFLQTRPASTSRMVKGKSVVAADEPRGRGVSYDRRKRTNWGTREAMDFDPKSMPLRSPRDVF